MNKILTQIKHEGEKVETFLKKHKKKITIGIIIFLIYKWLISEE
jgi:hypothetical protein